MDVSELGRHWPVSSKHLDYPYCNILYCLCSNFFLNIIHNSEQLNLPTVINSLYQLFG